MHNIACKQTTNYPVQTDSYAEDGRRRGDSWRINGVVNRTDKKSAISFHLIYLMAEFTKLMM